MKVIEDITEVIFNNTDQSYEGSAIIAIEAWEKIRDYMAFVDRKAELPENPFDEIVEEYGKRKPDEEATVEEHYYIGCSNGAETYKGVILKAGWVKEINPDLEELCKLIPEKGG